MRFGLVFLHKSKKGEYLRTGQQYFWDPPRVPTNMQYTTFGVAIFVYRPLKEGCDSDALLTLRINSLKDRREELCFKFAKNCLKIEKFKKFFPLNKKDHIMLMRNSEKYEIEKCSSVRYRDSALPYMRKLLNKYQLGKNKLLKELSVLMNHDGSLYHCENHTIK